MRTPSQRDVHLPTSSAVPASQTDLKRRRFLLAMGAGSAATAASAAQAALPSDAAAAPQEPAGKSGYRETDHVRTYYATTRI